MPNEYIETFDGIELQATVNKLTADKVLFVDGETYASDDSYFVNRYYEAGSTVKYNVDLKTNIDINGAKAVNIMIDAAPTLHPEYFRTVAYRVYEYDSGGSVLTKAFLDGEQPYQYVISNSSTTKISLALFLNQAAAIPSAYTEKIWVDYIHVYKSLHIDTDYVSIKDVEELKSRDATRFNQTFDYEEFNLTARRTVPSGDTTLYASDFDNRINIPCEAEQRLVITAHGLRATVHPEFWKTVFLRVAEYDANNSIVKRNNLLQRNGEISGIVITSAASVRVEVLLTNQAYSSVTAYTEIFEVDYLSVTHSEAIEHNVDIAISDYDALAGRSLIPSYYFDMTASNSFTANTYLDGKIAEIPKGKHFLFCTDQHWNNSGNNEVQNAKLSNKLMSYVYHRLNDCAVVFGGDVINEDSTGYVAYGKLCGFMSEALAAFGGNLLVCAGNHDINLANVEPSRYATEEEYNAAYNARVVPWSAARRALVGHLDGRIVPYDPSKKAANYASGNNLAEIISGFKMNYYYDDDVNKIRYIVISILQPTNAITRAIYGSSIEDVPGGQNANLYLVIDWLYDSLMSVKEGYDVVLVSHRPSSLGSISGPQGRIAQMLRFFKKKSTLTFTTGISTNGWSSETESGSDYAYTFDFSNAPDAGVVLEIGGDMHADFVDVVTGPSFPDIVRQNPYPTDLTLDPDSVVVYSQNCDAFRRTGYSGTGVNPTPMTEGTVTEQCFTVVTFTINGDIAFTRFGAGDGLVVDYRYYS